MVTKTLRNIAAVIVGLITFILVEYLTLFILSWIVSIPFIGSFISYPSDKFNYVASFASATTGISTMYVLSKISVRTKSGKNYAALILGIIIAILVLLNAVRNFNKFGFSFDVIFFHFVMLFIGIAIITGFTKDYTD